MSTTAARENIGFIGLGLMGHGIAKNIVDKGYPLTFLGRKNRKPAEDLLGRGAKEAATSKEVAAASDIVFICVTGSREVEAIIRGPGGLKEGLRKGSVVVDCFGMPGMTGLALAAELKALGIEDYFIVQEEGPNRWALSLGVFRAEDAAQARLATLRSQGVRTARVGARDTVVPKVWLQVKDVDAPLYARLRETARGVDGSELRECVQ